MKNKKKLIAVIMILVFLIELFPSTNVQAANKKEKIDHKYNMEDICFFVCYDGYPAKDGVNTLNKGHSNLYNFSCCREYTYVYFQVNASEKNAFEISILDKNNKEICKKIIKTKYGYIIQKLKWGKYSFKIKALKKADYMLSIDATDYKSEQTKKYNLAIKTYYVDDYDATIKANSIEGKQTWYGFSKKENKYKKLKTAKSIELSKDMPSAYFTKGDLRYYYSIHYVQEIDSYEEKWYPIPNFYIYSMISMFRDEIKSKWTEYRYFNTSKKCINKITIELDDPAKTVSIKTMVMPNDFIKGSFKNCYWALKKVTVQYLDGSKEVVFDGDFSIDRGTYIQPDLQTLATVKD